MSGLFDQLRCRVIGAEDVRERGHREVLLILAQTFDDPDVTLLCEPSVVGARTGAPDLAIIDPRSGVHTVEVKGIGLHAVRSIQPGGSLEIEYLSGRKRADPLKQARYAMFDVKDAAVRLFDGDLNIGFEFWVAFPSIRREQWEAKFGPAVASDAHVLFQDDLESSELGSRLRAPGRERLLRFQMTECPQKQLEAVMSAFGDSAVLAPPARPINKPPPGSRGERLNDAQAEYRALTEQQRRLASSEWKDGPRLVRGVAGSGKTVVLATQVARTVERLQEESDGLFGGGSAPPVLVVCFNRSLVPFIRDRIDKAYHQRTGGELPKGAVFIHNFNRVMYALHLRKFCSYHRIEGNEDPGTRAKRYLADFDGLLAPQRQRLDEGLFYAAFVDEGQDFHDHEYQVIMRLVRRGTTGQPRLFVFYDDAQNLYGLPRPTWADLGLDVRGRSVVMDESFRNTRQILEPAFNMLLGSHADDPTQVKTRGFADTQTLKEKGLIEWRDRHIHVRFASREGDAVEMERHADPKSEAEAVGTRCERWLRDEGVLPQDIMVLTSSRERARQLARAVDAQLGRATARLVFADDNKDRLAVHPGKIAVSTTASAKGYDAPAVIVAGTEEFTDDTEGRASLYVGCTRAREWLVLTSAAESGLVTEMRRAIEATA